jgi:protein-disulfide isomerase
LIASATTITSIWIVLASAAQTPSITTDGQVAAQIGSRTITLADLDERWRRDTPGDHSAAMQRLYAGRAAALKSLVGETLVEDAARARGVSAARFLDAEVQRRTAPVSDERVRTFYEANAESLAGATLEELQADIKALLERQDRERARIAVVDELISAGPAIRLLLAPPTQTVPVLARDPAVGRSDAPVTIVAFSDFQCPFCARLEPTLREVERAYPDSVRIVWKDFPLTSIHPDAFKAAEASHCAAEQGRYWDYHHRLFVNQQALGLVQLKAHAAALGLDEQKFSSCLDSARYATQVQESLAIGGEVGVQATPTVFVDGKAVHGAQPFDVFAALIDEALARKGEARARRTRDGSRARSE